LGCARERSVGHQVVVREIREYLVDNHFVVVTDHQNLRWLYKNTKGKFGRWVMALSEFDFEIKKRKDSKNDNAAEFFVYSARSIDL
jgi:hypothetical protein